MAVKQYQCTRCRYDFDVPYTPEVSGKKPRCPRCGSYAVEGGAKDGCGRKNPCDTGIFMP